MKSKLILAILILGVIYRLALTENGSFLFNMDNARDFVDVREMVELGKLRFTGPTSAIEGLYNGPLWYYLLAIPYIVTDGDPYSAIIMQIILWVIGGFFLLKLIKNYSSWLVLPIGLIWVASNYIVLANLYSFNPNPVTLLTPLFIYGLVEYLKDGKPFWIILVWFLAGAFFNFEMNFGIFTPAILVLSLFLINKKYFKDKYFWLGFIVFVGTLLPQLLFDLRHNFIMSKAIMGFLAENQGGMFSLSERAKVISETFFDTFKATLMNHKSLSTILLFSTVAAFLRFIKEEKSLVASSSKKNIVTLVSAIYILVPFLGYLILPVTVYSWHLGGPMAASLIIMGFSILNLWRINLLGKFFALGLSVILVIYSISDILIFFLDGRDKPNMDPSLYKNEIAAIDYVYNFAKGQNFKVYAYLPSVYDYPYQYLLWWYGRKKYGYVPGEYVYSPNKPQYIPSQHKFQGRKDNLSGLVFLIKEPDRIKMRQAWENDYKDMEFISKEMLGSIEIEIRQEFKRQ